jgi:peptidylprolyl isomerase
MEKVENGLFVSVDYTLKLENGEVVDTTLGHLPMEIKAGEGKLLKRFEEALLGMSLNEAKTITLSPVEGYGEKDPDAIHSFTKEEIPEGFNPEAGQIFTLKAPDGREVPARVVHVDGEKVILDLNHPLAGENLIFDIQVVNISATPTQAPTGDETKSTWF